MTDITPIIIDHTNYPTAIEPQNQTWGPWAYGDKLYVLLGEQPAVTGTSHVRVYSRNYNSTESVPWEELDSGNHPSMSGYEASAWQDGDGIYVVYNGYDGEPPFPAAVFRKFELETETWGDVISSFVDATLSGFVHLRSFGDEWVIYYSEGGPSSLGPSMVRKYVGSWTSPIHVSTNVGYGASLQIIWDNENGLFHLCWKEDSFFTTILRTYSRTYEPVSETLGPISQITDLRNMVFPGPGAIWNDKVVISTGFRDNSVFPPVGRVTVAYGVPTENPTWSEELVTTDGVLTGQWTVVHENGDLYTWWTTSDYLRFAYKSPGGRWSAPQTFYNEDGLSYYDDDGVSLVPWPSNNFFRYASIVRLNEAWNILLGGFIDPWSTMWYFHGFGEVVVSNNYCDEAQDLTVFAE